MSVRAHSIFILLISIALLQGCASSVKPWERGTLSRPEMQWVSDPMEAQLSKHVFFSKEASTGGGEAVGGGCGCN